MTLSQEIATKRLDENPTIADRIIIDILCPDADGCFLNNPYKVDNVTIYYVSRSYSGSNHTHYDRTIYDANIKADLDEAIALACTDASEENLANVESLRISLNNSAKTNTFYYTDAQPVEVIGTSDHPAWLSNDLENAQIIHVTIDEDGEHIFGNYEVEWIPNGMREGDYFVCWTWTPNADGDSLSNHIYFTLGGSTLITTSIPTHFTKPDKYAILMDRYLPEMFKMRISQSDLTPEVLQELGLAVAKGFTLIEDMANQVVDLIDANSTHEYLLPLMGNLFNLKLQTNDPTLWRRQIKQAIPLFKKKGTYEGLQEALSQASIKLNKFTKLWQVVSKYTHQEMFDYIDSNTFTLSKTALPVNSTNYEVYFRSSDGEWSQLDTSYIEITEDEFNNLTILTWIGDLIAGDSIRITYQIKAVPSSEEQSIEDYIRLLPLSDQRDERDQNYPLKNWNVRLIEEDDPLFDLVIPTRNPYYESLIYGKIRTEFPYSENIYNMDEYNGSRRDSYEPCDIDKDFLDPCSSCLSSKFSIDLEIENLSTDRILEAQEIIEEFVPFHAVLHSINLTGSINELIHSPIEDIGALITVSGQEFTISGNGQDIFNRSMEISSQIARNELNNVTTAVSNDTGTALNTSINLYAPNVNFEEIPLNKTSNYTFLEVLSPSVNSGEFTVSNPFKSTIQIESGSISEPLDKSAFTFRLSNERAIKSSITILKDNYITLSDSNVEFTNIKSIWDVDHIDDYTGATWTLYIPAYGTFDVANILPNGSILINDSSLLPIITTSNVTYTLFNDSSEAIATSTTGKITVRKRGIADFDGSVLLLGNTVTLDDIRSLMDHYHNDGINHYLLYDGIQYAFSGFVKDSTTQFYIDGWNGGDIIGTGDGTLYQRLLNNQKGYFGYKGLQLETSTNYEVDLDIQNGTNAESLFGTVDASGNSYILQLENSNFKENFLILIDTEYYVISEIDGTTITIIGPDKDWKTTGTSVNFDILKYEKLPVSIVDRETPLISGHDFEYLDRSGNDVIDSSIPITALAFMLNEPQDQIVDIVNQQEGINFTIVTRDGVTTQGEI